VDELDDLKQAFFEEAEEQLSDLEAQLAALAKAPADTASLNGAFRSVHSIKGAATLVGFARIADFAHAVESLLHKLRSQQLAVDETVVALLLSSRDLLHDFVRTASTGADLADGVEVTFIRQIDAFVGRIAQPQTPATSTERLVRLQLMPAADYLARGGEPRRLFAELRRLGTLSVVVDVSGLPPLGALDPDAMYLRWTMALETAATVARIRDVFSADLRADEYEIIDCGNPAATVPATPAAVSSAQAPTSPTAESAARGSEAVEQPAMADEKMATVPPPERDAAAITADDTIAPIVSSIRVDLDRMDKLVNLVGELVISQAMLAEQLHALPTDQFPQLARGIEELSRHARDLQEGVMAMRAQPVRSLFTRVPRLLRELAQQTGKRLQLVSSGEDTEIDKTVIEHLHDPITHMIRNAADHGIERPEDRIARGKSPVGTIRLSARQAGGRIIIEIADDGRGFDRERLRARAVEAGLIARDQPMTDDEVDNLIFQPGLSTAAKVSSISGRGVGMDIVRRNIQRLGGRVMTRSTPGQGSAFYMSLPLTLAVLDGMVIRVGDETYIVPLANVVESLRPLAKDVHSLVGGGDILAVRGEYVPLAHIGGMFGVSGAVHDPTDGLVMLVETDDGGRIGLVVDEIVGQQQVVIKSLETNYRAISGIGGATILGNGRVALIVDVSGLRARMGGQAYAPTVDAGARTQREQR
jgi:two-component system, chemotaxis family, sensor kinase CheA